MLLTVRTVPRGRSGRPHKPSKPRSLDPLPVPRIIEVVASSSRSRLRPPPLTVAITPALLHLGTAAPGQVVVAAAAAPHLDPVLPLVRLHLGIATPPAPSRAAPLVPPSPPLAAAPPPLLLLSLT